MQHAVTSPPVDPEHGLVAHVEAALAELYFLLVPHGCTFDSRVHVALAASEVTHASCVLQAWLFDGPQLVEDMRSAPPEVVAQVPAPKPSAHVSVVVVVMVGVMKGFLKRRRRRRRRSRLRGRSKWKKKKKKKV